MKAELHKALANALTVAYRHGHSDTTAAIAAAIDTLGGAMIKLEFRTTGPQHLWTSFASSGPSALEIADDGQSGYDSVDVSFESLAV